MLHKCWILTIIWHQIFQIFVELKRKKWCGERTKCFWEKVTKEGYLTHHPMGNFDGESCVTSRVPWEVVTRLSSGHLRSCPINGKQKTCRGDLDQKIQAAPFVDRIWDLVGAQGQRSAQFSAQPLSSKKAREAQACTMHHTYQTGVWSHRLGEPAFLSLAHELRQVSVSPFVKWS